MKMLLFLTMVSLTLAGCVAVPVYDGGYPYYAPYPYPSAYVYGGPEVRIHAPVFHGYYRFDNWYGFHGGHGHHRGRR